MKTVEQKREAVMAYCEEVCKGIEPCRPVDVRGPIHVADYLDRFVIREWLSKDGTRYANAHLADVFKDADFDPTIAYALLGLEACHDVAYEKSRLLKRYRARIKRLRADDAETHRIQIEVKDERISALEAKNAALVAAAELVIKRNWERINGDGSDYSLFSQAIGNLGDALAANENGGAND